MREIVVPIRRPVLVDVRPCREQPIRCGERRRHADVDNRLWLAALDELRGSLSKSSSIRAPDSESRNIEYEKHGGELAMAHTTRGSGT
jgi:hypothetical protein